MKTRIFLMLATACTLAFSACEKNNDGPESGETLFMDVEGTIEEGEVLNVEGKHLRVPEGKTLTVKAGAQIIFSTDGIGTNRAPIEFTVDGNLYCLGTEENPVMLTVAEDLRTYENTFAALWGGIVAGKTCEEMIIDHTVIEYTGGPVIAGSPAANNGYYVAGDDDYPQITTNNPKGKYIITNSIIRNGLSDGIYMQGGEAIIADNIFSATGQLGGEAVNIKSGCKVDVARNIMFSPNTNGLKLSSSDQSPERYQAQICAYNNTIIGSGWRREDEKGGGIYVEEGARVSVFNNLLVNCKFLAMTPEWSNGGEDCYDRDNSFIDYNYYASGTVESSNVHVGEYEDDGEIFEFSGARYPYEGYAYNHAEYDAEKVDRNSVIAKNAVQAEEFDPDFEGYDINVDPALYRWDDNWDFHLKSGSPALDGYTGSDHTPFWSETGLTVNGTTYKSPAVATQYGAFGTR